MDEFRKPFEYEEDTGVSGFILVFAVMLISFEMLYGTTVAVQVNKHLGISSFIGRAALVCSILYLTSLIFTCFSIFKIKKHAIKIIKAFLAARAVYLVTGTIIIFIYNLKDKNAIGAGHEQFDSVQSMIIMLLVSPLVYIVAFSISWFIYFCKSKKVKKIYNAGI